MPTNKPPATTLGLNYKYLAAHDVRYMNAARFTHLGAEVIMDVATVDDQQLLKALQSPTPGKVTAIVTNRFAMSFQTLIRLKENVDEMLRKLVEGGLLEVSPEKTGEKK